MNWHVTDAPVNPDPVTVSAVPPATDPARGATASTRGSAVNSNWAEVAEKSAPFRDTRTSTAPGSRSGATHNAVVSFTKEAHTVVYKPNLQDKVGVLPKPDPVTVITVLAPVGPDGGCSAVTAAGRWYVKLPMCTYSAPLLVTLTSTPEAELTAG